MQTTADILDRIGRRRAAAALNVGLSAISNAASANLFPASWFFVLSKLCEEGGVECPASLFNMKPVPRASEDAA